MDIADVLRLASPAAGRMRRRNVNSALWTGVPYKIQLADLGVGAITPRGGGNIVFMFTHHTPLIQSGIGAGVGGSDIVYTVDTVDPIELVCSFDPSKGTGSYSIVSSQSLKLVTNNTTANGNATLNFANTTGLTPIGAVGLPVTGAGIPAGRKVQSFTGTTIVLDGPTVGVANGASMVIGYGPAGATGAVTDDVAINHCGFSPDMWDANSPVLSYWTDGSNSWSRM